MAKKEEDDECLKRRTKDLLGLTQSGSTKWKRVSGDLRSTMYNIKAPEDGEDYNIRIDLVKMSEGRNTRYKLVSHDTGLLAQDYELKSSECRSLATLGELVFSKRCRKACGNI